MSDLNDPHPGPSSPLPGRLVWDLPLRLFHWLLVVTLSASWITAKLGLDWRPLHMQIGYCTLGLLIFRLLWGFIGPRHARFASFVAGPSKVLSYLRAMASGGPGQHSIGHNPAGGLMVMAMLLLLAVQACTGLFTSDDIVYAGPYNSAVSDATGKSLGHVHHINFNIILGAVSLHLIAVAFYAWGKKQPLVRAMITGYKAADTVAAHEAIERSELVKACVVAVISALMVFALLSAAPVPSASSSFN